MPLLLAASVTPLRDGGAALDEDAIGPMVDFLAAGGVDGLFALGTTGEGVMLSLDERMRAAAAFREACDGTLIVHCGAQSTADTVALAAHAASIGVDGVAVIPPPYYAFGPDAVLAHLAAAAVGVRPRAVLPVRLRRPQRLPARAVGGRAAARPRLEPGRPQGVGGAVRPRRARTSSSGSRSSSGSEPLIPQGLAAGAAGSVSGLAAAFPEVVAAVVRAPDEAGAARLRELRGAIERYPFQAALKVALGARGVPVSADVRAPARTPRRRRASRPIRELATATFVK